jgi:hypothetical protein
LISHANANPALPAFHPFLDVFSGYYWAETPCIRLPLEAWYVHLGGGRVFKGMKQGSYMVWPVRHTTKEASSSPRDGETRFDQLEKVVVDHATDLMWHRDTMAVGTPATWHQALFSVKVINQSASCGFDDWRLPNIREIESIVDLQRHSPALPYAFHDVIDPTDGGCWTSTSSALDLGYAWVFYCKDGALGVGFKTNRDFSVWPVRTVTPVVCVTPDRRDSNLRHADSDSIDHTSEILNNSQRRGYC